MTTTGSSTCQPMRQSANPTSNGRARAIPSSRSTLRPIGRIVPAFLASLAISARHPSAHTKTKSPKPVKGTFPCPVKVTLDFGKTPSLCPAFGLRLVRGVKNGPSPDWLQKRLTAIGLRPINALVDITNFITFDRGRPLHVFDAGKGAWQSDGASREEWREAARPRRQDLCA